MEFPKFVFIIIAIFSSPSFSMTCSDSFDQKSNVWSSGRPIEDLFPFLVDRYKADLPFSDDNSYAYYLAYANESAASPFGYLANILHAWSLHLADLSKDFSSVSNRPRDPLANTFNVRLGLAAIKRNMVTVCTSRFGKQKSRALVSDFFEVLDLQGASGHYSGLPFFHSVMTRFSDPAFREFSVALRLKLLNIADNLHDASFRLETNLLEIATSLTNGSHRLAIENLGVLLSRELKGVDYFQYSPFGEYRFYEAVGEIPLLVRLLAEVSRVQRQSNLDTFSYDGVFSTANVKNYYFWSSAFISLQLMYRGHTRGEIVFLSSLLPREYKMFRVASRYLVPLFYAPSALLGAVGIGNPQFRVSELLSPLGGYPSDTDFRRDALQVMRASAEGAARALFWAEHVDRQ